MTCTYQIKFWYHVNRQLLKFLGWIWISCFAITILKLCTPLTSLALPVALPEIWSYNIDGRRKINYTVHIFRDLLTKIILHDKLCSWGRYIQFHVMTYSNSADSCNQLIGFGGNLNSLVSYTRNIWNEELLASSYVICCLRDYDLGFFFSCHITEIYWSSTLTMWDWLVVNFCIERYFLCCCICPLKSIIPWLVSSTSTSTSCML